MNLSEEVLYDVYKYRIEYAYYLNSDRYFNGYIIRRDFI